MEKIIKLLNEAIKNGLDFQGNDILKIEYYSEMDIRAYYDKTARAYYNITIDDIISKRAGFIKRLIENDKIGRNKDSDRSAMLDLMRVEIKEQTDAFEGVEKYEWYIMALSIQDDPVGFLISILK